MRSFELSKEEVVDAHERPNRSQPSRVRIEQAPMRLESKLGGIYRPTFGAQGIPVIDPVAPERELERNMLVEPPIQLQTDSRHREFLTVKILLAFLPLRGGCHPRFAVVEPEVEIGILQSDLRPQVEFFGQRKSV